MSEKAFKVGLVALLVGGVAGALTIGFYENISNRKLANADVAKRITFDFAWRDIAGFYDSNKQINRVVVRNSYSPMQLGLPIASDVRTYTPNDKEFPGIVNTLTNSSN